jgi:hypothetical protein
MHTKIISFLLLTLSLFLISPSAKANSFTINGTSFVDANDQTNIVTGGTLNLLTEAPGGPLLVGVYTPGATVPLVLSVQMYSQLNGGFASVVFGNQSTGSVLGGTLFSGTFTAPLLANNTDFSITFPVSMIGNVIAFKDLGYGIKGPVLFALAFKGSGTMTLTGVSLNGMDYVQAASVSFAGTATTVPEPGSLLLVGSGLASIIRMRRKAKC